MILFSKGGHFSLASCIRRRVECLVEPWRCKAPTAQRWQRTLLGGKAAALLTLLLRLKPVVVASASSVRELLAPPGVGVVEPAGEMPLAGAGGRRLRARIYERETVASPRGWEGAGRRDHSGREPHWSRGCWWHKYARDLHRFKELKLPLDQLVAICLRLSYLKASFFWNFKMCWQRYTPCSHRQTNVHTCGKNLEISNDWNEELRVP